MRQKICVVAALFMAACLPTAVRAQSWNVVETEQGTTFLRQEIPDYGGNRQYQFVIAMCAGNKLIFNFAAARYMQKPKVFISEGGFGETELSGEFLKMNSGDPQVISLTPAASQKLRRYIAGGDRQARKEGSNESSLPMGPGGLAASDAVDTTGFTALARRTLTACFK